MPRRVVVQVPAEITLEDIPENIETQTPFSVRNSDTGREEAFVMEKQHSNDLAVVEDGTCFEVDEWYIVRAL
jgi:hypothetical protein